ncbi:MAG: GatB/YqeY domain-containing protein [Candidatus Omnitrophica bacterium]|nr:GatB/YqeY domain-containing protein [Candidatus Omnitrophota bacterium]MBU4148717.1 GatB/YqeY domain-containing protein [Candidatus Omnitrophota bacterium]
MGDISKRIANDLKESIKNKDATRTSTLRMVTAAIQNLLIEKKMQEPEDRDVLKILAKQIKQHQDSIESFKRGNRQDLAEKERQELEILKSYMPEQLGEKEIEKIVKDTISKMGASLKSDFGKVMKAVMEETKGQADGKMVSSAVQKFLQG